MMAWEERLTEALAGPGANLAAWLTHLGEPLLAVPILVVGLVMLHGRASCLRRMRPLVIAGLGLLLLVQGAKRGIDRPRPALQISALRDLPGGHLTRHAFPSGHSALAAFVAGALMAQPASLGLRVGAAAVALLVGWSRVAIGAHWVGDVLVGLLLGFGLAIVAMRRHPWTPNEPPGDELR